MIILPKKYLFDKDEVQLHLESGKILDARKGGLVIGRSHAEGDIWLLRMKKNDPNQFEIFANMEGGEYILQHEVYWSNKALIESLNKDNTKSGAFHNDVNVTVKNKFITHQQPMDKYLLFDYRGMFIVNKYSTYKYLQLLENINH